MIRLIKSYSQDIATLQSTVNDLQADITNTAGYPAYIPTNFGVTADGVTNDATALNVLLGTIDTDVCDLIFTEGTYLLGTNVTIPENVTVRFLGNSKLKVSTGITVTISGNIVAPINQQIFDLDGTGVVTGFKNNELSLMWWGAIDNDTEDCVDAFRASLAQCGHKKLLLPLVNDGIYLCNSSVVDETLLADGLTIEAVAFAGNQSVDGVVIKYTGSGICFNVQAPLGTNQVGSWEFKNLLFKCTHTDGSMFAFNDVTVDATDDSSSQYYIRRVKFTNCIGEGEGTTATQNGNFLQATKLFELVVDELCEFRYWKRAFYLKGCDNYTIKGRYYRNVRHIMTESSGFFGNSGVIDSRFLGYLLGDGVGTIETAHQLHIGNNQTILKNPWFEGDCGTGNASLYVNASTVTVESPYFALVGDTWLEMGSSCADLEIYNPRTEGSTPSTIIYNTPVYWEWTGNNNSFRTTIINPSTRFERWLTPHPQLKVISPYNTEEAFHKGNGDISIFGETMGRFLLTAFNLERATSFTTLGPMAGINQDSSAYRGYSISLDQNDSFGIVLQIGKDIQPDQVIEMKVRYKNDATPDNGSLRYITQTNSTIGGTGAIPVSTDYTLFQDMFTISGTIGDNFLIGVYNSSDALARVSAIEIQIIPNSGIRYGNNAPTTNYHTNGEMIYNYAPTPTKNILYWRCITSGTPGTWMAYGMGHGDTTNRPSLTTGDNGYSYYDTTVDKVIVWTGSTWLE